MPTLSRSSHSCCSHITATHSPPPCDNWILPNGSKTKAQLLRRLLGAVYCSMQLNASTAGLRCGDWEQRGWAALWGAPSGTEVWQVIKGMSALASFQASDTPQMLYVEEHCLPCRMALPEFLIFVSSDSWKCRWKALEFCPHHSPLLSGQRYKEDRSHFAFLVLPGTACLMQPGMADTGEDPGKPEASTALWTDTPGTWHFHVD